MPETASIPFVVADAIALSIVVPVYSGEDFLEPLVKAIAHKGEMWAASTSPLYLSEAIFVCDEPRDNSVEQLEQLARTYQWLKVHTLSRNYGQHPATMAGCAMATGDWIVTMDEDLQHPPALIDTLIKEAATFSHDVVYGRPLGRAHSAFRDTSSRMAKRIIGKLLGTDFIGGFNSFRVIRGPIARAAAASAGFDTYFDVAITHYTRRMATLDLPLVDRRLQETGTSGYNLKTLIAHARRLAFSGQIKSLRIGGFIGVMAIAITFAAGLITVLLRLVAPSIFISPGWASLILANMFFGGVILMLLGVTLEYLSSLIVRAHGRPTFFVVDRESDKVLADYFSSSALFSDPPGPETLTPRDTSKAV